MKKMRVAVFHELESGGARRAANSFSQALVQRGHIVDRYYIDDNENRVENSYYSSSFFFRFSRVRWNGNNWRARLERDTLELVRLNSLHKNIAKEIDGKKYDAVFVHPSKFTQAPFILRHLNTPTLYYCQEPLRMVYEDIFPIPPSLSFPKKIYERTIRFIRKHIDRVNLVSADYLLFNSRYTKSNVKKIYGLEGEVCHMGVNLNIFSSSKGVRDIDILFIGTREMNEGYGLFQKAKRQLPSSLKIMELIRGENWTKNDKELANIYSRTKCVLCLGYNEPFGLIPIEAMACGAVPIGLSEGGYLDSIIHNETGLLVKRDGVELAKTIKALLSNTALLSKLSRKAQQNVQKYWTWDRGAKQIKEVVNERLLV